MSSAMTIPAAICHPEPRRRLVAAVAALAVTIPLAAFALDSTAQFGGPGGKPFIDQPESEVRVMAVAVRAGDFIDAIGTVYRRRGRDPYATPLHGGNGGDAEVFELGDDERIIAISGGSGRFVEWLQIHTNRRSSRVFGRPGDGRDFRIEVPEGQVAIGFSGRSGKYLDAIGLVLRPVNGREFESTRERERDRDRDRDGLRDVRIDGSVSAAATPHAVMLEFRLATPASPLVQLVPRRLRPDECLSPNEPGAVQAVRQAPSTGQLVTFAGLRRETTYHYSIQLDAGRCVSGAVTTAD
jgi:hypothetical protein